jgi:hypothetical protein
MMNVSTRHKSSVPALSFWLPLVVAWLTCSCATKHTNPTARPVEPVRKVDCRRAPELKELGEHARTLANAMYPQVCALLLNNTGNPPAQFDIVFAPIRYGSYAAVTTRGRVTVNTDFFTNQAMVAKYFDRFLVHELAHVATQSRSWTDSLLHPESRDQCWLGESAGHYALYKLIGPDNWVCAQCDALSPYYTSGYTCGGAFLLQLEGRYGTNLIPQLIHVAWSRGDLNQYCVQATGKNLEALWGDFQQSAAFKPGAREAWQLRCALGYTNFLPPSDILKRFDRFVKQNADDFTQQLLRGPRRQVKWNNQVDFLVAAYVYLNQPGGAAERFVCTQAKAGSLPGLSNVAKPTHFSCFFKVDFYSEVEPLPLAFPCTRTVDCELGDDELQYHYTVSRDSQESPWRLEKAWQTLPDGSQRNLLPSQSADLRP